VDVLDFQLDRPTILVIGSEGTGARGSACHTSSSCTVCVYQRSLVAVCFASRNTCVVQACVRRNRIEQHFITSQVRVNCRPAHEREEGMQPVDPHRRRRELQ
jgi:hypothetical protein